jgi:tetratricopeptide (TPR) repeat protein
VDASIYESSGDPVADQDALDAIRAAAPFYRVPEGAPRVITIRFDFASKALGYVHQVNWIALEAQQQRALLLAQQTGNNQSIADSLQLLGDFKREQGKYEEAAAFYNRALDVLNRAEIGKLKTATVTARLADTCLLQGKTAEAEGLYKQSITMIDQSNEANSPEVREILQSYAKLLYKLSRFDEANEVYARLKR